MDQYSLSCRRRGALALFSPHCSLQPAPATAKGWTRMVSRWYREAAARCRRSRLISIPFRPIFSRPICSVCHIGGAAPEGLRLDAADSFNLLVGVPSTEVPSLLRVKPGDPDNSYIIQKLEGHAAGRCANAFRMPLDATLFDGEYDCPLLRNGSRTARRPPPRLQLFTPRHRWHHFHRAGWR